MTKILGVFDVVPGWVYALALGAVVATSWVQRSDARADLAAAHAATARAEKALSDERAAAATSASQATKEARTREAALQKQADLARKADQNEIRRITAARDRALDELRQRPARPDPGATTDGLPTPAGTGQAAAGCTGAQLYREDGEFLVREAARASIVQRALQSCYAAYDRARPEAEAVTDRPDHAATN